MPTKFPLTGAHATVTCALCHTNGQYATLTTACSSCHLKDYQGTTNPNHVAAGFPQDCQLCHTTTHWTGAKFDHTTRPSSRLTGAHITATCAQCHSSGSTQGPRPPLARRATSKDYQAHYESEPRRPRTSHRIASCATPPRIGQELPSITPRRLRSRSPARTPQPLACSAIRAACTRDSATTCNSCHLKDFQGTTNPNHVAAGFPQDCSAVPHHHGIGAAATFNHSADQVSAHRRARHHHVRAMPCQRPVPRPPHGLQFMPLEGLSGHHQSEPRRGRLPAGLLAMPHHHRLERSDIRSHHPDHVPAHGQAHRRTTCVQCHSSGVYKGLNTACNSCHLNDYQGTTNPNHAAAGFPQDCQLCHTTTDWTGSYV